MARRQYSNIAVDTTLVSGISPSDTSLAVASASGWPSAPFVAVLEPGTADEELILVGTKTGTTFSNITRGFGGSSAVAHSGSDVVKHVIVAEDMSLIWTHLHTSSGGDDTAQLNHDNLSGVSADDHHAKLHSHNGADGSGTVAITDLTGTLAHTSLSTVGANDHHNEDHGSRHIVGGADEIPGLHREIRGASYQTGPTDGSNVTFVLNIPATWTTYDLELHFSGVLSGTGQPLVKVKKNGSTKWDLTGGRSYSADFDLAASRLFVGETTTGAVTFLLDINDVDFIGSLVSMWAQAIKTS